MDFVARPVFGTHMATRANRPLSTVSVASGATFIVSALCTIMLGSGVFLAICAWSVPVLLVALVYDVCRRRYWALIPLTFLVALIVFVVLALRSFDIPVGG